MTVYVSMLRAVNVGGTSRIKMDALRAANDRVDNLDHEAIIWATEHPDRARGWLEAYLIRQRARNPIQELTERERQVLALMAEGRSNQAIGERLFLSPKTVEAHVHSIFTRLDLHATPDDHRRVLAVLAFLRA